MAAKSYFAEHVTGLATYQLPASLAREIGRIMVHWAYFEHCVQEMNWQSLDLSAPEGRIAMREPRVTDRLEMLCELVNLRGATWDTELYKSILARSKVLAAKRDLLAHGIWGYLSKSNEWHVQLARGTWPKNVREIVKGSKKITPEGVLMDTDKLRSATTEMAALIDDLKRLRSSTTGPPRPSQKKPD